MFRKITIQEMIGDLNGKLGEDDYSEPLSILIDSANKNNTFNFFGSIAFKNQLKDRLKVRSEIYKLASKKNLSSPADMVFVTGLPRSGTTFLFNMLALDTNHRSPKYWEIMKPLPLVHKNREKISRQKKINKQLKLARTIIPKLKAMHHIRAETPEECMLIATINIRSIVYLCMADVPEYVEYLKNCSFKSVFEWHKKFFQILELTGKPERWLLKDPSHIGHIPEILEAYPNAKFINIHRDPVESIGSFCSLTKNVRLGFSKKVNNKNIGDMVIDFWRHKLYKGMQDKENLNENQIANISYEKFVKDPINTIKDAYLKLGLDMSIETENKMQNYLNIQKSLKKQKHNYTLEEFGLSSKIIKNYFKDYILTKQY
ncbi:MAG: sulfotransferase family protein [Gammaproteobacteria bacterium]|nr:sulfotransferase family protein [Gammaproteobacteria bacterium]